MPSLIILRPVVLEELKRRYVRTYLRRDRVVRFVSDWGLLYYSRTSQKSFIRDFAINILEENDENILNCQSLSMTSSYYSHEQNSLHI